jgi:OOP family OmpA-OmpF porin
MMKNKWGFCVVGWLIVAFISACAVQGTPPPAFEAQPIPAGKWNKKVDYLYFILDASSSMSEAYKLETAKSVITNFNKTMPPLDIQVALRSFGHDEKVASKSSVLMVKPQMYTSALLDAGLAKVTRAGGTSPLDLALKDANDDLKDVKAPIALIIVSDGKDMDDTPIAAAKALKDMHGDGICIYTVQVGQAAEGQILLAKVAQAAGCGKAVTAQSLENGTAMNAFVREVLLGGVVDSDGDGVADDRDRCPHTPRGVKVDASGCPLDSDKDGVRDDLDQCPGTPVGTKVDAKGCPVPMATKSAEVTAAGTWIYKDIQFEINRSDLKESSYPILDEIVAALKAQPNLKIEIQGHTDNTGAHAYNVGLSQKRAESVQAYLESKGIDSARMTSKGFGPDRPIDTNNTKQGRARNRRVELKPIQ